jgi:hypothetical protein
MSLLYNRTVLNHFVLMELLHEIELTSGIGNSNFSFNASQNNLPDV